jgi:decaprenylphospho-beta-D-ribofuranose 2-oxidase
MAAGTESGIVEPPAIVDAVVSGWGNRGRVPVWVARPDSFEQLRAAVIDRRTPGAIARGMGRSYGDAAQLARGLVLDTTALRGFELDAARGILRAEAGATLGELLGALAPAGWVLPVVPGTQHVTVGGAIAADIHGKNHGVAGTFGAHVLELGLMTASGEVLELTPEQDGELLDATIGGMGLTGVIVWAAIRLCRLPTPWLAVDIDRVGSLDEALAILDGPGGDYRVAWLDLLGAAPARGVVTRADHAVSEPSRGDARTIVAARGRIPPRLPGFLPPAGVVRAYNEYRFRRAPRRAIGHLEPFGAHMFPLDALEAWPRLYGPGGFVQYQLVVPKGRVRVLDQVILALRSSSVPCYLAVLKDFGAANGALLSFPMRGWTLTLDLPGGAPGLSGLLDRFDELLVQSGGRVYLAKDGRLRPDTLAAMYPHLDDWRAVRDRVDPSGRWLSDLGLRTGMVARQP